jgi:hypothetical protein
MVAPNATHSVPPTTRGVSNITRLIAKATLRAVLFDLNSQLYREVRFVVVLKALPTPGVIKSDHSAKLERLLEHNYHACAIGECC